MILIGIDDTDMPGTPGTGRIARALAALLAGRGWAPAGVTRHQLLVHPDIPYTSQNSSACIGVEGDVAGLDDLFAWACRYVEGCAPEGSDPGVCVAHAADVPDEVTRFGKRAKRKVVRLDDARQTATAAGLRHAGLGGTNGGIIGAVSAVGLRTGGGDGRYVDVGRVREFEGLAKVGDLLGAGIDAVRTDSGRVPEANDLVQTCGWVRPRLIGGRPVLIVKRRDIDGAKWIVVRDRKERAGHAGGR